MVDVHPLLFSNYGPELHKTNRKHKMFTDTCHPPGLSSNNCTIKMEKHLKDRFANLVGSFPKELRLLFFCQSIK